MDKTWSELNKRMQTLLGRETTYKEGIECMVELRHSIFSEMEQYEKSFPKEAFFARPFPGVDGYHSKTLAYSIWHIFRIEDIVAHELIMKDAQIFDQGDYQNKIHASIRTTGNELKDEELEDFSKQLELGALYEYAKAVMDSTEEIVRNLTYSDLKMRFGEADQKRLMESCSVSEDPDAVWLIEYWTKKDVRGLIRMPFSRHWIMHMEAMRRIRNRLCKQERKESMGI